MRIAVNLSYLHPAVGGSLVYTARLVEILARRSDVAVGLFGLDDRVAQLVLPEDVLQSTSSVPIPGLRIMRRLPHQARRMYLESLGSALARPLAGYDVLWSPGNTTASRVDGLPPSVVTIHDLLHLSEYSGLDMVRSTWRRVALRRAAKGSTFVVTPSVLGRSELIAKLDLLPDKVVATGEGVDVSLRRTFQVVTDVDYVICPASNHSHKNHRLLFEAFRDSELHHGGTQLLLVGWRYPRGTDLASEARRAGISPASWTDLGYVPDYGHVLDLMARSRAVVLPSLYEGWSLPALEALALGRPVVAHAVGGVPEFAHHGATIVTEMDDVAAWTRSLDALESTQSRSEEGTRSEMVSQEYSWDGVADRLLDVFRRCANGGSSTETSTGRVETG